MSNETLVENLLKNIDWDVELPNNILKFKPTSIYFFERTLVWNVSLTANLCYANKKVFKCDSYLSGGKPNTKDYEQFIISGDTFDDICGKCMFIADNIFPSSPTIFSNANMDWLACEFSSEGFGILAFKCDESEIIQFLDYFADQYVFDWNALSKTISTYNDWE